MLTTFATLLAISASSPHAALAQLQAEIPGVRTHAGDHGTINRIYGKPLSRGRTPSVAAEDFLTRHADVWGLTPSELSLQQDSAGIGLMHDVQTGQPRFRRFRYSQVVEGVPVFGASVTILATNTAPATVVMASADTREIGDWRPTRTAPDVAHARAEAAVHAVLGPLARAAGGPQTVVYASPGHAPRTAVEVVAARGFGIEPDHEKPRGRGCRRRRHRCRRSILCASCRRGLAPGQARRAAATEA